MNDEIKEIREYISCPQFGDDHYGKWGALRLDQRLKIKSLLDYITNLQEENEKLKTTLKGTTHCFDEEEHKKLQQENERLKRLAEKDYTELNIAEMNVAIYKSRCEKAIEHIKEHYLIYTSQYEEESNFDNHLLDILNGGDEE